MTYVKLSPQKLAALHEGGVWVPCPLALSADHTIWDPWQRLLVLYYLDSGPATVIPGTHTGEFAGHDLQLYDRWLRLTKEMIGQYGGPGTFLRAERGRMARM